MKRIYITKKVILIFALLFVVVLGAVWIVTPKLMALNIEKLEQAGPTSASMVLKERLIRFFPASEEARWEVYELADYLLQGEGRVIIGPNFTTGGGRSGAGKLVSLTAEEVILYLEKVAAAEGEAMWKYNCYEKIGELYKSKGNIDKAEEYFLLAAKGFEKENQTFRAAQANKNVADMYLEKGEAEKALAYVERSLQKFPNQLRADFLAQQGDAYYNINEYAKADESYRQALEEIEKRWAEFQSTVSDKQSNINATKEDQPGYKHCKSRLEQIATEMTQGQSEKGQVQGEILIGSNPMSNVIVYLIEETEHDGRMSNLEEVAALPSVKTDAQGKFEFSGVSPSQYFIALGIMPEDLEGLGRFKGLETFSVQAGKTTEQKYVFQPTLKILEPIGQITFEPGKGFKIIWEEAAQAASYNLHITLKLENGYVSRVYRQNLKGNSYLFNPEGLALREMNFVTWGDKEGLAPSAILGSFYPGAEIYLVVEAIDPQGRSISDSEGYVLQLNGNYPSIVTKEKEGTILSSGDKFVLERKYSDAIKAYEEELKIKPNQPETLLSLARIYNHYGDGDNPSAAGQGFKDSSDPKKAMEYYTKLLKVSREKFIVEEAASTAVRTGDDKLALDLLEEVEDAFEENSFWYHLMGELYFRTGQTEKSLTYYLKYLDGEKNFVDLGPVIAMLYMNDVSSALSLLEEKGYSQSLRHNSTGESFEPADIGVIVSNLKKYKAETNSNISSGDFRKYLKEIISITNSERSEKVSAFLKKLAAAEALKPGQEDVLLQVLLELAKDRR